MSSSYDVLRDHCRETLLGRLRLGVFEQITGNEEDMPTSQEVRHFVAEQYLSSSEVGTLLLHLLSIGSASLVEYDELQQPSNLSQLLCELDEEPLERARFLEMTDCPEPLPTTLGALVYREELREGGYVYIVTLLDDTQFPDCFAGRAEIRSSQVAPEPAFGILDGGGYVSYSLRNYRENPWAVLMAKILNYVNDTRFERFVPVAEISRRNLRELIFPRKSGRENTEIMYNATEEEDHVKEKEHVYEGVQDRSGPVAREKWEDPERDSG